MKPRTRSTGREALTLVAAVLLLTLMAPGLAGGWTAHAEPVVADTARAPANPGNENPRVLPPNAQPYGTSYGEWGAQWWTWATAQPLATSPLFDQSGEFCDVGQSGRVWFLAGIIALMTGIAWGSRAGSSSADFNSLSARRIRWSLKKISFWCRSG